MMSHEPPPPEREPQLPLWLPFAVLAAVILLVLILSAGVAGVLAVSDAHRKAATDLPQGWTIALTAVQDALFIVAAFVAVQLALHRPAAPELGLRRVTDVRRVVLTAVGVFAAFWVITGVLQAIFGSPPDQHLVTDLKTEDALPVVVGYAVLICLVAPFAEEIFFRGLLFGTFARRLGPAPAAVIAGTVFGLVHAPNPVLAVVGLCVLGVGLCVLYWRTQSIIPCMALHALNNSISFAVTKSFSWEAAVGFTVLCVGLVTAVATAFSARPAVTA